MNISQIQKMGELKKHWERFQADHPKVTQFAQAVYENALEEGTVIEINVTTPEGAHYKSNLRLNAADMDTIQVLKDMQKD